MHPYRAAGPIETERDREELRAFARAHRRQRRLALAGGLGLSALTVLLGSCYGWWFYFGSHCGFACM